MAATLLVTWSPCSFALIKAVNHPLFYVGNENGSNTRAYSRMWCPLIIHIRFAHWHHGRTRSQNCMAYGHHLRIRPPLTDNGRDMKLSVIVIFKRESRVMQDSD